MALKSPISDDRVKCGTLFLRLGVATKPILVVHQEKLSTSTTKVVWGRYLPNFRGKCTSSDRMIKSIVNHTVSAPARTTGLDGGLPTWRALNPWRAPTPIDCVLVAAREGLGGVVGVSNGEARAAQRAAERHLATIGERRQHARALSQFHFTFSIGPLQARGETGSSGSMDRCDLVQDEKMKERRDSLEGERNASCRAAVRSPGRGASDERRAASDEQRAANCPYTPPPLLSLLSSLSSLLSPSPPLLSSIASRI